MLVTIAGLFSIGMAKQCTAPSQIAVFLDFSGSIDDISGAWDATLDFAEKFAEQIDESTPIGFWMFNDKIERMSPFSTDREVMKKDIAARREMTPSGRTNLLGAFEEFENLREVKSPESDEDKPLLLIVTDGEHNLGNGDAVLDVEVFGVDLGSLLGRKPGPSKEETLAIGQSARRIRDGEHTIIMVVVGTDAPSRERAEEWTGRNDTVFPLDDHEELLTETTKIVAVSCGVPPALIFGGIGLILLIIAAILCCCCVTSAGAVVAKKKWSEEEVGTLEQTYSGGNPNGTRQGTSVSFPQVQRGRRPLE